MHFGMCNHKLRKGRYTLYLKFKKRDIQNTHISAEIYRIPDLKSPLYTIYPKTLADPEIKQEEHTEESERKESWMEKKKEEEKEGGAAAAAAAAAATATAQETTEDPEQYRRRLEIAHEETVAMLPHNIQGAVQEAFENFIESFEKICLSDTQV